MAVLPILSYTSASLVMLSSMSLIYDDEGDVVDEVYFKAVSITGLPLFLLDIALLLQPVIALSGMRVVRILTWNTSPFDATASLIRHAQLIPVPLICIRNMSDLDVGRRPVKTFRDTAIRMPRSP